MRIRPIVFVSILATGLLVTRAWSQESAADVSLVDPVSASVADESDVIIHGAEPTENVAKKGKSDSGADTLSVDFPDEDVRNILRNVADLFELNLVVPDLLQGRTSIKLRDVTWRQIFEVVLSPVGFTYIEDGNIIKIVSRDSLLQEPVTTEVFILNYARAADIMPTLNPLIDTAAGGNIVVDARSNALVITERPSKMSRIRPIIETLDKATDQVMIESKFVEVTNSDVKNIGVNWASLNGMQVGVNGINQTWSRERGQQVTNGRDNNNSNATTTNSGTTNNSGTTGGTTSGNNNTITTQTGFSTDTTLAGGAASSVTFPNGNVTLTNPGTGIPTTTGAPRVQTTDGNGDPTVLTLPISTTNTTNIASNGTSAGTSLSNSVTSGVTNSTSGAINELFGLTNTAGTSRLSSAVFSASDFNIILSALKTTNDTKLVSNPTVVTLNNTEAVINIGKDYPIPSYTYNQQTGAYEVSGFEYKSIGIILKVTPQVNARGFIKLTVEPEVSSSQETANFGTANIPIVTIRKTKTQVSLQDGFTMGIGGLMENTQQNIQTRVPVLGSIPIIGRLFRSDGKNDNTRNLIIFITAKTVSAEGATIDEIFDSRRVRQLNMHESDLPGYRDASNAFITDEEVAAMNKKKKK